LPPTISSALKDRQYSADPWNAVDALVQIKAAAADPDVRRLAMQYRAALAPVDPHWLKRRLLVMMAAHGHERDPERVTGWLAETGRLLIDLPGSILAEAIDEAIKRSERGFLPAVGQIRAIAEPLLQDRERQARRLEAIVAQMDRKPTPAVRPWEEPTEPKEICTPEQAAAIKAEFGLVSEARQQAKPVGAGPARKPSESDYIALMGEAAWRTAKESMEIEDQ
jgi:hypothetical protein